MGDRVVDCARLESVCAERHRGFESPPSAPLVERAQGIDCITVSHNSAANFSGVQCCLLKSLLAGAKMGTEDERRNAA